MKNKIIVKKNKLFLILILIIIISLITVNFKLNKNQKTNKANNNINITQIPTPSIATKNPISYMFFSYQIESIDKDKKLITVYLKGSEDSLADAADFKINFNNIKIEKISEGDSFVYYPRKEIKDNYLLITGVALDENNNFKFAKPNTLFVKILIKINETKKNPASIYLDNSFTRIYLSGSDITKIDNLFKEIKL